MAGFSGKKLLLLGFIIVILVIIPLTVYLVQQQQKTQIGAAPSTTLSLIPATVSTTVNQTFDLNIDVNPGSNQVSFIKFTVTYDQTKLATGSAGFRPNSTAFQSVLQGPTYEPGRISATLSVGSASQNIISAATRVGTISFRALSQTTTPTAVGFDRSQTQVLSVASADQFNEDVLLNAQSSSVTIAQGASPTPSPTPSPSPSASPTPSPTPSPATGTGSSTGTSGTGTGTSGTSTTTVTVPPTSSPSATATPTIGGPDLTTLPPAGPGDLLLKLGGAGILLTILFGLILIVL